MRSRRNVCPTCHWIGNQHLCGCIAGIGRALEAGDLDEARRLYQMLVDKANMVEQFQREYAR